MVSGPAGGIFGGQDFQLGDRAGRELGGHSDPRLWQQRSVKLTKIRLQLSLSLSFFFLQKNKRKPKSKLSLSLFSPSIRSD
jgi:hypothetical protein